MTTQPEENPVTISEAEEPSDAEYDKAFDEAAAARSKSPADEAADDDQAPDSEAGDDEAEPDAGEDPALRSEEGTAAKPAPAPGTVDWATASPELRAAHEAAIRDRDHRLASTQGRLSALDRELARLREGQAGGIGEGTAQKPLKELLASDEIKTAREEFPDALGPVLDVFERVAERLDGLQEQGQSQATTAAEAAAVAQEKALTDAVPDWTTIAANPGFVTWLNSQPRHVREAAGRNWDAITDAEEAADVFERAKAHFAPPPEDKGPAPGRRERQAAGTREARVSGPTAASGEPQDYDSAFDAAARKSDRQRGIKL